MVAADNQSDSYILPRDDNELTRLNKQHEILMRHIYSGKLIVDETVKIGEHDFVLDSAAGTGAWALELSSQLPASVQIYATDISPQNFPSPESTPINLHFLVANSLQFPMEWSNKFDFVHQRLLVGALRAEQWPIVMAEIFRILKPGGAIQLVEGRPPIPKGPAMEIVTGLLVDLFKLTGLSYDIPFRLEQFLADAGFSDIHVEAKGVPVGRRFGDQGVEDSKTMRDSWTNLAPAFEEAGLIQSRSDYYALLDQMEREWDEHGSEFESRLVTARKPAHND